MTIRDQGLDSPQPGGSLGDSSHSMQAPRQHRQDLIVFDSEWRALISQADDMVPYDPDLEPILYGIFRDDTLTIGCMTRHVAKEVFEATDEELYLQQKEYKGNLTSKSRHSYYLDPRFIAEELIKGNLTIRDKMMCEPILDALLQKIRQLRAKNMTKGRLKGFFNSQKFSVKSISRCEETHEILECKKLADALTPASSFAGGHYLHAGAGYNVCDKAYRSVCGSFGGIITGVKHYDPYVIRNYLPIYTRIIELFEVVALKHKSIEEFAQWMKNEGEALFQKRTADPEKVHLTISTSAALAKITKKPKGKAYLYVWLWNDCHCFIQKADGSTIWADGSCSLQSEPLKVTDLAKGEHKMARLDPEDIVVLLSDGITKFLSREEIEKIIAENHLLGSDEIERAMRAQLKMRTRTNLYDRKEMEQGIYREAATNHRIPADPSDKDEQPYISMSFCILYAACVYT